MVRPRCEVALALAGLLASASLLSGCGQGCGSGSGESAKDAARVFVDDAVSASTTDDVCRMVYEDDADAALDWARRLQETGNTDAASLTLEEKPDSPLGSIYEMEVRDSTGATVATITVVQSGRRYYVLATSSYVGEESE